jgi:hypothetical protein
MEPDIFCSSKHSQSRARLLFTQSGLNIHSRMLDEGVAQIYAAYAVPPTDSTSLKTPLGHYPASCRIGREKAGGHPVFARCTLLFGGIYSKWQRYHAALQDDTSLLRDSCPVIEHDVAAHKSPSRNNQLLAVRYHDPGNIQMVRWMTTTLNSLTPMARESLPLHKRLKLLSHLVDGHTLRLLL